MKITLSPLALGAKCSQLLLFAGVFIFATTLRLSAADDAAAQKLFSEARAKEVHAQELRAASAAADQKAADDRMEASADERDARILGAQALKLLGADANKQKAFKVRQEARKFWIDSQKMLITARNDEQRAAQQTHNAEELRKSVAELKDQPTIASTLEAEANEQSKEAQNSAQTGAQAKLGAQSLEERARAAWAEAEKLDPETHRQVAPASPKPAVAQPRQVK
jgi:hypothetical protein